jgi:hypothetical protein
VTLPEKLNESDAGYLAGSALETLSEDTAPRDSVMNIRDSRWKRSTHRIFVPEQRVHMAGASQARHRYRPHHHDHHHHHHVEFEEEADEEEAPRRDEEQAETHERNESMHVLFANNPVFRDQFDVKEDQLETVITRPMPSQPDSGPREERRRSSPHAIVVDDRRHGHRPGTHRVVVRGPWHGHRLDTHGIVVDELRHAREPDDRYD